jgi:hypothetical protein
MRMTILNRRLTQSRWRLALLATQCLDTKRDRVMLSNIGLPASYPLVPVDTLSQIRLGV